jgi:hypothetical protein
VYQLKFTDVPSSAVQEIILKFVPLDAVDPSEINVKLSSTKTVNKETVLCNHLEREAETQIHIHKKTAKYERVCFAVAAYKCFESRELQDVFEALILSTQSFQLADLIDNSNMHLRESLTYLQQYNGFRRVGLIAMEHAPPRYQVTRNVNSNIENSYYVAAQLLLVLFTTKIVLLDARYGNFMMHPSDDPLKHHPYLIDFEYIMFLADDAKAAQLAPGVNKMLSRMTMEDDDHLFTKMRQRLLKTTVATFLSEKDPESVMNDAFLCIAAIDFASKKSSSSTPQVNVLMSLLYTWKGAKWNTIHAFVPIQHAFDKVLYYLLRMASSRASTSSRRTSKSRTKS